MEPNQGKRRHKLLTARDRKRLPALRATEGKEAIAQVKFFSPYNGWRWYAVEFDGEDTFFGFVEGFEKEWGYFSYRELTEVTVLFGKWSVPAVERELSWEPQPVPAFPRWEA